MGFKAPACRGFPTPEASEFRQKDVFAVFQISPNPAGKKIQRTGPGLTGPRYAVFLLFHRPDKPVFFVAFICTVLLLTPKRFAAVTLFSTINSPSFVARPSMTLRMSFAVWISAILSTGTPLNVGDAAYKSLA